ncbi:MAG: ABC transporter permease [Pyrinomonadaceae bacterium]
MSGLIQDLRYGVRMLLKSPGFTFVTVLTLALGIGANSTIYSVVQAVLLRPLPVAEPGRLVALSARSFSYPAYTDFRDGNTALTGLAGYSAESFSVNVDERSEIMPGSFVSGNYFDVLGVGAVRGRTFLPEEDRTPATHPVAVISHQLWQRSYGGAADVIGKSITVNSRPLTIIGVAPQGFRGLSLTRAPEVWVPISMFTPLATGEALQLNPEMRGWGWLSVVGRLKEGASIERAQAEVGVLTNRIREAYPRETPRSFNVTVTPIETAATGSRSRADVVRFVSLLVGVVSLALLIACANVANLLLARASRRRKEIAVRVALGASRGRIVRQLLVESLLLALMGGALGLLVAVWALEALAAYELPGGISIEALGLGLDRRVFGFTLLASVVTGVIFGLVPALQVSKPDLVSAIKDQSSAYAHGRSGVRHILLVVQIALCLVLIVGAGLFIRSLRTALAMTPGFETEKLALASVNLGLQRYTEAGAENFYHESIERVGQLPGVVAASWATTPPLVPGASYMLNISIDGYEPRGGEPPEAEFNYVGDAYFKTVGVSLLRGREFTEADRHGAPPVVVINVTMARRFFPDVDPLGRNVGVGGRFPGGTIVGVVRDAKYHNLNEVAAPYVYAPLKHSIAAVGLETLTLLVRTSDDPARVLDPVRNEIRAMDANLPISDVVTIREHIGDALIVQRFGSTILGLFSSLTLVLATVGIYGITSYFVTQRTREIGIRMALGAHRSDILRLVLAKSLLPVGLGVVVGLGAALVVTRALNGFLYGVSTTDPATFAVAALLLTATALLACYIPARRATKVDPMIALRYE